MPIMLSCVQKQKAHGVQLIGIANKTQRLRCLWALPNNSKHNEARILMDSLCLRVIQMPRSRDLAIFMPTITDDRQSRLLYPLVHRVTTQRARPCYNFLTVCPNSIQSVIIIKYNVGGMLMVYLLHITLGNPRGNTKMNAICQEFPRNSE